MYISNNIMATFRVALCSLLLSLGLVFTTSCGAGISPNAKRFELHGRVVSVQPGDNQVTVAHDEIPGYMDAMTMPFSVRNTSLLSEMKPGDEITAALVVDGSSSWLDEISVVRSVPISGTSSVAPVKEPTEGAALPEIPLVNQDKKELRLSDLHGKAVALTFIYTRCPLPDYCIRMNDNFGQLEQKLKSSGAVYDKTHLLSISFDPERDTPAVLKEFGATRAGRNVDPDFKHWEFVTASPSDIRTLADFFGLTYEPESGQIIHSLRTVVVKPDGTLYKVYKGNDWKPDEILSDLSKLTSS
jgi:protein SCO1